MAVLDDYRGIKAEVLIAGEPAVEYDDIDHVVVDHPEREVAEYQVSRTVSKYIQSETGQKFSIKFTVGAPYIRNKTMDHVKIGFHVEVDGKPAGKIWLSRTWFRREQAGAVWKEEMRGIKVGKGRTCTISEFMFAKIETNDTHCDPAAFSETAQRMKPVGKIEIKVYNETAGKKGGDISATTEGFMDRNGTDVSERALKGDVKSHGTSLSRPKKASRGPVFRTKLKDGEDCPLIVFQFLYRDEDALKQLGVIYRNPSPSNNRSPSRSPSQQTSPLLEPNNPSTSSIFTTSQQAELSELMRKMTEQNTTRSRAPREASASGSTSISKKRKHNNKESTKIKREMTEDRRENMKVARRERTKREAYAGKAALVILDLTCDDTDNDEVVEEFHTEHYLAEDDDEDDPTGDAEEDNNKGEEETNNLFVV